MKSLRIDGKRLWSSLMEMGLIGATPLGGSCRLALTDEDKAGRDLFVSWCEAAGCKVTIDRMGNIFARRFGTDPERLPIVAGSHLDTQPHGGKFDGVYGVLAALEVVRTLNDHNISTQAPIEIVVWTNEEGSRFAPAMLASAVFAGVFDLEYGLNRQDLEGVTVSQELNRIGYAGNTPCGDRQLGAFFEVHIEQGPILEREQKTIGVVLGGQGSRWYDVKVTGQDAHAGSTPMAGRRDALVGSAKLIEAINQVALNYPPNAVATVGQFKVSPNSRNTIVGEVNFTIDLRHFDAKILEEMSEQCQQVCENISAIMNLKMNFEEVWYQPPVIFNAECINAVRKSCNALKLSHQDIVSGAGHDACLISRVAPTSMIFVPCAGGISHNELESATPEDLASGCNVLLQTMLGIAKTQGSFRKQL